MIILLSDDKIDREIIGLLSGFGYKESDSELNLLTHHFITIDETTHTFRLSNANRKRGEVFNAVSDKGWKPFLMEELLNPKISTPLYPYRPKFGQRKQLEAYRGRTGLSMSATVSLIVSVFFEKGLHEIRNKDNS